MRWIQIVGMTVVLAAGAAAAATASESDVPAKDAPAWDDVAVVKLWQAVSLGLADAKGAQPRSYRQVELTVSNRKERRVAVDLAGSHLRPQRLGSCQRLGLGPPAVTASVDDQSDGRVVVHLEPGETRTLLMNTCCLDSGKPAPSAHRFRAVAKALPAVREKVLRWWVDNPEAPQYAVNSAIWRNRPNVVVSEILPQGRRAATQRLAAALGGVYYQVKDRELSSLDAEGVRRVLGSQVRLIFPTDAGVYAMMPGDDGYPDLWLLAPTGENPWGFVTDLDNDAELLDVVPAGRGNLVLLTGDSVDWFEHESGETKQLIELKTSKYLSARRTRSGHVDVTLHDPRKKGVTRGGDIEGQSAGRFEVWRVDTQRRRCEMRERFWNVSAISAGPAGIYGLSHKGALRRVQNGKFKDTPGSSSYASIVAVGTDVVWLLDDGGRLVAANATSGRRRFVARAEVAKGSWYDLDPVTDDLVFALPDSFQVVRGADGKVETIPDAE